MHSKADGTKAVGRI